jgi:23S rRNA (guanosine2251-2'-O)-methyltransferase
MDEFKRTKRNRADVVKGIRPVLEALVSDRSVEKILLRKGAGNEGLAEVRRAARAGGVPIQEVPTERLDREVRGDHQGVLAFVSDVVEQDVTEIVAAVFETGVMPLVVVLDEITDVRNLGAIARSAEVLGAHAILVPRSGSARLGPDAVKSSAGALLRIPVCRVSSLSVALRALQEQGLRIVACTESGQQELHTARMKEPLALVLGNEEHGISTPVLRLADELVRIPMMGKIGSLNVSVAAGIALYAVLRGRGS